MEHLNSILKLLVTAVNQNHNKQEISGLAHSLSGAAIRISQEHKNNRNIGKSLLTIADMSDAIYGNLKGPPPKPNIRGPDMDAYHYAQLNMESRYRSRIRRTTLPQIQKRIQAIAKELKIELEEILT